MTEITKLQSDQRKFSLSGEIGRHNALGVRLLKRHFSASVQSGELTELRLHCSRKYVFFRFEPDMEYEISNAAGVCDLELIGTAGSKFRLTQS